MVDKQSFSAALSALVDSYLAHEREYSNSKEYNEFSLRREFLDPFFEALGWDMSNSGHKPPHLRVVRFERPNEKRKKPDYVFLLPSGAKMVPQFIVEAKAPSESLDTGATITQAKSYAWNTPDAPTPIALLTNFGELKVYDGSLRPDPMHPERGLVRPAGHATGTLNCREFVANVDFLWNFSRESVEQGSLEVLLPKSSKERQYRVPVDEAFLHDMTDWREDLAKDLYKRNPSISAALLSEVVQRTLDRLVFIRMAEDRGIIPDRSLLDIVQTWRQQHPGRPVQNRVNELYQKIHLDLDGEIFEEHACEQEAYWFTPALFATLVESLYFPESPYLFDVIGVELLGSIYERFLGKTIRLTEKRVHVEDKPSVRKAGGIYYTPRPVVEYIVETAVGSRVKGMTPEQMAAFRVLDPACGSGSFLVGAYSRLIAEHIDFYSGHPEAAKRGTLYPNLIIEGDIPRLSIECKAAILRNSIFGVDVDSQAVEVTMMSLYLKALEGEQTLPENKALLPRLKQNVRWGNSLVGPDGQSQATLDGETILREPNPFDWQSPQDGFGRILAFGGFDAVIGNPPYIRIQQLREFAPAQAEFVTRNYPTARGNVDLYIPFIEKATSVVAPHGTVGYIVSHKFFKARYGAKLRELVTTGKMLSEVVNFAFCQVFKNHGRGPTTYTCMLFLSPGGTDSIRYSEFSKIPNLDRQLSTLRLSPTMPAESGVLLGTIPQLPPGPDPWELSLSSARKDLLLRLRSKWPSLLEFSPRVFQGNKTGADDIYILDVLQQGSKLTRVRNSSTGQTLSLETAILRPLVRSEDLHRYDLTPASRVLLFPYVPKGDGGVLVDSKTLEEKFPRAWAYLQANRPTLSRRKGPRTWWAYSAPKSLGRFERKKILTPDLAPNASFSYDPGGRLHFPGGVSGGYGILIPEGTDPYYLLGLLNSRLLDKLLQSVSTQMQGGWYSFEHLYIKRLPIRVVDPKETRALALSQEIARSSARLCELYPRLHHTPPSTERDGIEREVRAAESAIDERVAELYDLTSEDRAAIG
jgi:hypothetical protein